MADEEERIKAEKLAAAKKRVAQLQKQKKKAKKTAATESPKDTDGTKETPATPGEEPPAETPATETQAELEPESVTASTCEPDSAQVQAEEQGEDATAPVAAPPPVPPAVGEEDKEEEEEEQQEEGKDGTETVEKESEQEAPLEPMPEAPISPDLEGDLESLKLDTPRAGGHGRQPSLSIQSKMRSSSFRKASISHGSSSVSPSSALIKSPSLPPLNADGETVHEVFRKQVMRIEELEKENKRLDKELEDVNGRWRKTEDQLEDLREASVDVAELKEKLERAEQKATEVNALKAEIASLQRQNSHLSTRSHRSTASVAVASLGASESPPSDLVQQLESKSATIEAMELEISNLRAQLTSQSSSSNAHEAQISALEDKLSRSETSLEKTQRELADTKHSLTRAAEKAMKEGVDKTSTETLIKTLQREIEELNQQKSEGEKKIDALDKKLQALGNLHKESEARHQARLRESEKTEKEAAVLRKKLASIENENLRLREERERHKKRDAIGAEDEALDELEDEERARLERRVRELEGEVFDLRRGVWRERRQELEATHPEGFTPPGDPSSAFDDVDLVGGAPDHSRRRSMAQNNPFYHQNQQHQQQHSSFSDVLSSGLAAFTGTNRARAHSNQQQHPPATRGSLELLAEENLDDEFDEAEFARAQAEEEARKRVEWVREVKRKLKDWNGWRLDLVDSRAGAEGAGVAMGEIFEV
ncbi:hypothetical protein ASPZODRAFT_20158 [Penicilliopsis zonata CBS 506.65]|uniref:M protein repeat protein n=1 Tax=Penicilliopsis zonata CBS 506.65 TaxID=1073090 RepID=A0A1L9S6X0_9EURO|nr:hypothetical protein ASPZODRAFT_20158 [Penicilliopsis zonata CBS 506.65]OJJ42878.1 hypothetical protein ASPZODRAFT_20158 [Penicilliopsis zonata CBS 506.65]